MGRGKSKSSEKQKTTKNNEGQSKPNVALEQGEQSEQGEQRIEENGIDEKAAVTSVTTGTDNSNEDEEDDNGEVSEVWDIIRVIPTAEEKIECRYENCSKQAVATWASDKAPDDKWPLCEECQLEDFGGWPEGVDPIERNDDIAPQGMSTGNESACQVATPTSLNENTKVSATPIGDKISSKDSNDAASLEGNLKDNTPPSPPACTSNQVEEGVEDRGESFELSNIIPLEKLLGSPVKCHDEACNLPAFSIYTSSTDPKKWYYCIDCQERDFGGWPSSKELPCDYLEPEHLETIAAKCSKKRNPAMPIFSSHCVTPLPKSPHPPKGTTSDSQKGAGKNKPSKFSASALARHEKWQADAKKLGVNRIIVKKEEAKKVVFDTLYDAFHPMNINDIYTTLKKMIPSPVLSATLEDMTTDFRDEDVFNASDDENSHDEKCHVTPQKKSDSKEPYAGSLVFKAGRNAKSNIYYVDYTKIKEMDNDSRQELASKVAVAKGEHGQLILNLRQAVAKTTQFLSEPSNDELGGLLSESEKAVTKLKADVNDAKALMVNEGHRKKLKRRIQSMAGHYRKRKQLCCSFLSSLEEVSDGTISKKKCLNGDGQIALDSDENTNKSALAYAKSKKRQKTKISLADENFVGVLLDSQGMVKRVYVDEK
eukprot:jgi/Psemu1/325786/estExt_fgenesh1_pg.C_2860001